MADAGAVVGAHRGKVVARGGLESAQPRLRAHWALITAGILLLAAPAWGQTTGNQTLVVGSVGGCAEGQVLKVVSGFWACAADATGESGGVPAGTTVLILTGSCATTLGAGWDEANLGGKFLLATTDAAADIGTTGGADTITDVLNHTHPVGVTDPGHTHVENKNSATTGGLSGWAIDTSTNTSVASGYSTATATTGITASSQNPAGGVASLDNRPAFIRVIACTKA